VKNKIEAVLKLDCRISQNNDILKNSILEIPQINKKTQGDTKKITLQLLEKYISLMCRKYTILINYITPNYIDGQDDIYCVSIKNTANEKYHLFLYANSINEAYSKMALAIYDLYSKNELKVVDWNNVREEIRKR
jgi:hypothetical protein